MTMADITQALADLDAAIDAIRNDITSLQGEIAVLKSQGSDTGALQAAADSIEARAGALAQLATDTQTVADAPPTV
jgi:uncharacterized protein involved in exopolysaccharide biosynthesis